MLADINAFRAQHGLAPLRLSTQLTTAARAHSQQMARDGLLRARVGRRLRILEADADASTRPRRGSYWSVGENLLWSSPGVDGARALKLWLASPEHPQEPPGPQWREIGVSAVHVGAARPACITVWTSRS